MARSQGTILTLPPWQQPSTSSSASRDTLNNSASSAKETQLTLTGFGTHIRYIYGRVSVGAVIPTVVKYNNDLLILCVFSANPSIEIEKLYLGDTLYDGNIHIYLGDQTEPDAWLAAAIDGYNDVLAGYTYTVLRIQNAGSDTSNFTNIRAIIKGQPIDEGYDNPAHVMAHFATHYMGLNVDETGLLETAARCDELIGGERRRTIALSMDSYTTKLAWLATMAEYAGCYYTIENNTLYMIAKKPRDVSRVIDGTHIIKQTIVASRSSLAEVPNRINVSYTLPTTDEKTWTTKKETATLDSITNLRESNISMPGFTSASMAKRFAIERLNEKNLCDLHISFNIAQSVAHGIKKGDVISVSSFIGIENKRFTVLSLDSQSENQVKLSAIEYDENAFSDVITTDPSSPDTNLPSPDDVAPITGLNVFEQLKVRNSGIWDSYLVINYDHDDSHAQYEIQIFDVRDTLETAYQIITPKTQITTSALPEFQTYLVKVRAINNFGFNGDWVTTTITTDGKRTPPTDVAQISGIERGGIVFLNWTTSLDMDLRDYIVKWMPVGDSWDSLLAQTADVVKSLQVQLNEIPSGRWDFCVKARDWAGNISTNEARVTVEVDEEAALKGDEYVFDTYNLINFEKQYNSFFDQSQTRYITSFNESIQTQLTGTLDAYTDKLVTYHSAGTSSVTTETHDYQKQIAGEWRAYMTVTDIDAPSLKTQHLSTDNVNFDIRAETAKGTYQYVYLDVSTENASVVMPPMRVNAIAKERDEKGSVRASQMTAGQLYRIYLTGKYYDLVDITVKTAGIDYRAGYEDVVLSLTGDNYFDVFIADTNNNLVARDFTWVFTGR